MGENSAQKMTGPWKKDREEIRREQKRRKHKGKKTTRCQRSKRGQGEEENGAPTIRMNGTQENGREVGERENNSTGNYRSEEARETETERSDRGSRHSRGNLIEAERERTDGIKRNEERKEKERAYREQQKYAPPRRRYW